MRLSFLGLIGVWTLANNLKSWGVAELTSFCDEVLMIHLTQSYGPKFGMSLPAIG